LIKIEKRYLSILFFEFKILEIIILLFIGQL
jgi:hypothetical protein